MGLSSKAVTFTPHAIRRMEERSVTPDAIFSTLRSVPEGITGEMRIKSEANNCQVVLFNQPRNILIETVYPLRSKK